MNGESIDEEELVPSFETLREMIAWGALFTHGVRKHPQRCVGMLESSSDDARLQLGEALQALGFEVPIATGRYCGVFRGPGMDMVSRSKPVENPHLQGIDVGAADATTIRRLLGEITSTTSLELKISQWDPVLP